MTQNPPNPPEQPQYSASPAPSTPPVQQSLVKRLTINLLRGTINLLEVAVNKLEAPPPAEPQPSIFNKIGQGWLVILRAIRSVLPASFQEKLPNWGLSSALIALLVVSVGSLYLLITPKSPEVAINKPVSISEPTPPILTAPTDSRPVEPLPPPTPQLTPEQALIASIQSQVAEVTGQYSDNLIESIQANFRKSILAVTIAEEWYSLEQSRQNKLVKDIQQRAKALDFSRLELQDYQGTLVARSAVIGNEMIILKRRHDLVIREQS